MIGSHAAAIACASCPPMFADHPRADARGERSRQRVGELGPDLVVGDDDDPLPPELVEAPRSGRSRFGEQPAPLLGDAGVVLLLV